jgi:hypothetical protein
MRDEAMTPKREEEIRQWTEQKQHCEFYGSHWEMAKDLLSALDALREENKKLREVAGNVVDTLRGIEEPSEVPICRNALRIALEAKP